MPDEIKPLTKLELHMPLWDKELCARYLRIKYRQFAERVRFQSAFPPPAVVLGRKVLWRSVDVRTAAGEFRQEAA